MVSVVERWERTRCDKNDRTVVILDDASIYFGAVGRVLRTLDHMVVCVPFDPALVPMLRDRIPGQSHPLFLVGAWHCSSCLTAVLSALTETHPNASVLVVDDGAIAATSPPLGERIATASSPIACSTAELDRYLQTLVERQHARAPRQPHASAV